MEMYGSRVGHSPRGAGARKARSRTDWTGDPRLRAPVAALLSVRLCAADSDKRDAQGPQNNKQTLPHFPNVGEGRHKGGAIPLVAGLNAAGVKAGVGVGGWRRKGATPPVVPTKGVEGMGWRGGVRCCSAVLFSFKLS